MTAIQIRVRRETTEVVRLLLLSIVLLNTVGCMKKMAMSLPNGPDQRFENETDRLKESLFKGDQQDLSNQDIDCILTANVSVTDRPPLAVLGLSPLTARSQQLAE